MGESTPVPPVLEFRDRRGGLIGFGILLVVLGCLCALLAPLMFVGQALTTVRTGVRADYHLLGPMILTYAGMAAVFTILGIGSILARRWARALALILAWVWLLSGIVGTAVMAFVLPKMFGGQMPDGQSLPVGARQTMVAIAMAFIAVIYVVLPGLLVFFYGSRHVKATCEFRDPVRRWTDACPLPVLALSLIMGFGALSLVLMPVVFRVAVPFFGVFATGWPEAGLLVVLIGLSAYSAWSTYRLRLTGWWVLLVFLLVMTASTALTFARHDLLEMYQLAGYSREQLAQMQRTGLLSSPWMPAMTAASPLAMIGYMLWVKKFFR